MGLLASGLGALFGMGIFFPQIGTKSALMGIALTLCFQIESIYPATHGKV